MGQLLGFGIVTPGRTGLEGPRQKIVLGLVILAAVIFDQVRRGDWRWAGIVRSLMRKK